ncbi:MAG: CBS domain-containing protein [Crocinitomicaceae bacterium]
MVKEGTSIEEISKLINKEMHAVLVELEDGSHHIVTRHDIISAIG